MIQTDNKSRFQKYVFEKQTYSHIMEEWWCWARFQKYVFGMGEWWCWAATKKRARESVDTLITRVRVRVRVMVRISVRVRVRFRVSVTVRVRVKMWMVSRRFTKRMN